MADDRLSPSDVSSLIAERGPIHVHVGGTLIGEGDPPGYDELLDHIAGRLHLVPRFRQRVTPDRLNLHNPVWADDPTFDLRWHVRHAALPSPGSLDQLRDLVGQLLSQRLDVARPLWQVYLIEGLEGGRFAVLSKTHHSLVDGLAAIDIGTIILDPTPEGAELPLPDEPWEPDEPSPTMLFVRAASDRVREPLRAARTAATQALTMPVSTAQRLRKTAEGFASLASGGPSAPATPFNVEIGPDRRVGYLHASLADVKAARTVPGSTVNDVILAASAGGLGRFLRGRGVEPPDRIVALVPVSLRRSDDDPGLGNRITTLFVPLPVAERDPAARLEEVQRETSRRKESEAARAASLIIQATGWTPPTINRLISEAMARPLTWNLVISNVPGPQAPFYLLGRRVREVYPFVPLSPQGRALSIGILSYDGGVFFGLAGDRDRMADLGDLVVAMEAAVSEQLGLKAGSGGGSV